MLIDADDGQAVVDERVKTVQEGIIIRLIRIQLPQWLFARKAP